MAGFLCLFRFKDKYIKPRFLALKPVLGRFVRDLWSCVFVIYYGFYIIIGVCGLFVLFISL